MEGIKNIIFDLGAVLIDIDFQKVTLAFEDIGIKNFDKQFSQLSATGLFENLETGRISNDEFYQQMIAQAGNGIVDKDVEQAWNAILQDFRLTSLDHLVLLKDRYRLFLLSNTNDIHLKKVNEILFRQTGRRQLDDYFTKAYYSHKVGLRKPGEAIFQYVLKDAGLDAADSFFIDDALPNVETALQLGFRAHQLLPGERIENLGFA
jgi:HAD superfamily hydrolase (TIGR01549 family)